MNRKWATLTVVSALAISPFVSVIGQAGSTAYASSTTKSVSTHQTSTTASTQIAFTTELANNLPAAVSQWVNENSDVPGTLFMSHGGKTYILVSRGWQAGTRTVKIVQVNRLKSAIQVTYQNVDPKPGSIDSHMMGRRYVVASIPGIHTTVHFVKKTH